MGKTNRNASCRCGSKKKYKQCCIEIDEKLNEFQRQGYPIPKSSLLKTIDEIEGIKKSCQLTKKLLNDLNDIIKPGMTTNEINNWVHHQTLKNNAIPAPLNYKNFPKSICTSVNEVVCHGIPSEYKLEEGDMLNVDITCILNGFYGDSCRMYEVGNVSNEASQQSKITKECLEKSIQNITPFTALNIIGETIENHAHKHHYSVVKVFGGHGTGNKFHEDPFIYHYKLNYKQMIITPGMVFTIEPMINEGTDECIILEDGWTAITKDKKLSTQWEHTIVITNSGATILT